jgi:D-alanyl-D-alanine-carboxypeptidase/D-alanyl-D-alanine-endopeptidase
MSDNAILASRFEELVGAFSRANGNTAVAAARIMPEGDVTAYSNCDPASRFEIGSITKVFTAILLCEAVLQGRCSLDDPVEMWLPDGFHAPRGGKKITLRHLATHSSGLPRLPLAMILSALRSSQPYENWNRDRLARAFSRTFVDRMPGSMYAYSNFGFSVLGLALERICGKPYEELLGDLTVRLDCEEIRLPHPGDTAPRGLAVAPWKMAAFAPAGGATSTLAALMSFAKRNLEPAASPALALAMNDRADFRVRPRPGSAPRRTALFTGVAAVGGAFFPASFVVPYFAVEFAAFAGGPVSGVLATLGWEFGSYVSHASVATCVQRLGFGLFATAMPFLSRGFKGNRTMGLGWHTSDGGESVWHNGGTAGFRSYLGIRPEARSALIVLSANKTPAETFARQLARLPL